MKKKCKLFLQGYPSDLVTPGFLRFNPQTREITMTTEENEKDEVYIKSTVHMMPFLLSGDEPKDGDKVITKDQKIWTFRTIQDDNLYWTNKATCTKIEVYPKFIPIMMFVTLRWNR